MLTLIRICYLYRSESLAWEVCLGFTTAKFPKRRSQLTKLYNIMVRDNSGMLNSVASMTAINLPDIGLLTRFSLSIQPRFFQKKTCSGHADDRISLRNKLVHISRIQAALLNESKV